MNAVEHEWWLKEMRLELPVNNADNEWLGPRRLIGLVWEVNGDGAEEVHDFHATKHELIMLVKYWTEILLDIEYRSFLDDELFASGYDLSRHSFALNRVNRICGLLGDETPELDRVIDEVFAKYAAGQDKRTWDAFLRTSESERLFLCGTGKCRMTKENIRRRQQTNKTTLRRPDAEEYQQSPAHPEVCLRVPLS